MTNKKHLMTGPLVILFSSKLKIHCSPRDQSLSDLLYSKTKPNFEKRAEIPATTSGHL